MLSLFASEIKPSGVVMGWDVVDGGYVIPACTAIAS